MLFNNKEFYTKSIQQYGISPQGVHWNSKYSQYKRFEILTSFINNIDKITLLDAGCGFGEYYNFLKKNNLTPKKYIGIDCEEDMIRIATKRFPTQQFFLKNILYDKLPNVDYIICSGTLNLLTIKECEIVISKCITASKQGFIFNYLKNTTFTNISKKQILDIVYKYTTNIKIKENYLENDFTIDIKKRFL